MIDRSWTTIKNKFDKRFYDGAKAFSQFCETFVDIHGKASCPCRRCLNGSRQTPSTIHIHIVQNGFDTSYTFWHQHGDSAQRRPTTSNLPTDNKDANDGIEDLLGDAFPARGESHNEGSTNDSAQGTNVDVDKLFVDMEKPLYPGYEDYSVLSFLLQLMHAKITCKMTNKSMDLILHLMCDAFKHASFPKNHYEAKKYVRTLGLGYVSIHACQHDCVLFWKENVQLQACPVCGTSRWVENKKKGRKIPRKVLRYFPVTSRLKRLFSSRHTAKEMRWHADTKVNEEDTLRHPGDGLAWKHFDKLYPDFASDSRNVRLGLASDGFNPFGALSLSYSMWPVVLFPYNMPPWISMSNSSFMLTLLIPGKDSPGKDIDVYLRPLIDELKVLWVTGFETYNYVSNSKFNMKAALLWTVNDFPAYGYLSGWSTSGYKACPTCNEENGSVRIRNKIAFLRHRRFLPKGHKWRKSKEFNGKSETRLAPRSVTGDDCLRQLRNIPKCKHGKHELYSGKKRKREEREMNWAKKSIFFELPYWSKLLLRHNIDVMHVEKNVCENLLGTLLNIEGKTKDTDKARLDLEDMGIRPELHLVKKNGRWMKPHATYVLTAQEKRQFLKFLKTVRFPDGFASNLESKVVVDQGKIFGLKSHDCHILLQRILPIGLRPFLPKGVREAISELCRFFKKLTSRTLKMSELETLQDGIVLVLCKLERIFPPAFFTVMVHLCVHLPQEAMLGGPVHSRWMYPIERYLGHLKKYVRNKAKPEGSIAEGYVVEEALTFCTQYLSGVQSKFGKRLRNEDTSSSDEIYELDPFRPVGRSIGKRHITTLSQLEMEISTWFVLNNCIEVQPYIKEHFEELEQQFYGQNLMVLQQKKFPEWFRKKIGLLRSQDSSTFSKELYSLSCLPHHVVNSYSGYMVNGVKFLVKSRDDMRKTQNSGVTVVGVHGTEQDDYFGYVNEIIELSYVNDYSVILFKCTWFDHDRKRKHVMVEPHFLSFDTTRSSYTNDPFIFASQAQQVFYVDDPYKGDGKWKIVERFVHRHLWDIPENDSLNNLLQDSNSASHDLSFETVDLNHIGRGTAKNTSRGEDIDGTNEANRNQSQQSQIPPTLSSSNIPLPKPRMKVRQPNANEEERKRGLNMNRKARNQLASFGEGVHFDLEKSDHALVFVGVNANAFASECGCLMRHAIDPTKHRWRDQYTNELKNEFYEKLKNMFELDLDDDSIKITVDRYLHSLWIQTRSNYRNYWLSAGRDRNNPCPPCTNEKWYTFCDFWETPDSMEKSRKMSENRKKQKWAATGGSISISNHRYRLFNQETQKSPSPIETYERINCKGGRFQNDYHKEHIEKIRRDREMAISQASMDGLELTEEEIHEIEKNVLLQNGNKKTIQSGHLLGYGPVPKKKDHVKLAESSNKKYKELEEKFNTQAAALAAQAAAMAALEARLALIENMEARAQLTPTTTLGEI